MGQLSELPLAVDDADGLAPLALPEGRVVLGLETALPPELLLALVGLEAPALALALLAEEGSGPVVDGEEEEEEKEVREEEEFDGAATTVAAVVPVVVEKTAATELEAAELPPVPRGTDADVEGEDIPSTDT